MKNTLPLITAALSIVAAACGGNSGPNNNPADTLPKSGDVMISYEVRLRDGGTVKADIQFRLPSGELENRKVQTPWSSDLLAFKDGDVMLVRAKITEEHKSPLLCVLASQDKGDGAFVLASIDQPLTVCETEYELGQWPPDDDDPIGNPLIRIG